MKERARQQYVFQRRSDIPMTATKKREIQKPIEKMSKSCEERSDRNESGWEFEPAAQTTLAAKTISPVLETISPATKTPAVVISPAT